MNGFRICCVFLTIVLSGCSANKTLSYKDNDGSVTDPCKPFNIGHRLGGDLSGNRDNTLEALNAVVSMQTDRCFKYWEFDVGQAADGLVIWHDLHVDKTPLLRKLSGDLPGYVPTLEQLYQRFAQQKITKPIVIDLKYIPDKQYWPQLKSYAERLQQANGVPVRFMTASIMVEIYAEICELIASDFEIRLYLGKGDFCQAVKEHFKTKAVEATSMPL